MDASSQDKMLGYTAASEYKTNHVLHLILTLVTAGAWSWIWLFISSGNITKRNKIKKKFSLPTETNTPKMLLWINAIFWVFIIFMLVSASKGNAASSYYDKCLSDEQTPQSECSFDEYDRQDKRLNVAYKAVIDSKPELKEYQRAWIKLRDNTCKIPAGEIETGRIMNNHYMCLFEITEKRANELEGLATSR